MAPNVSDVVVRTADGQERRLGEWTGTVLLIVNVASRCGFTRQYAGLQTLQERFGPRGFAVLGFPCNDFGAQEPGSLEEIQQFCSSTYGVSFPLFDKVHATGSKTAPYDTLTQAEPVRRRGLELREVPDRARRHRAGPLQERRGAGRGRADRSDREGSGADRSGRRQPDNQPRSARPGRRRVSTCNQRRPWGSNHCRSTRNGAPDSSRASTGA